MKKTVTAETATRDFERFFDESVFDENYLTSARAAGLANLPADAPGRGPDLLLAALKWSFLYLPGAASINLMMMGFYFIARMGDLDLRMLPPMFVWLAAGSFMVMLGIGRLFDLRYLRVVGVMSATAAALMLLFGLLALAAPAEPGGRDYFGTYLLITFLLTAAAGVVAKVRLDRRYAE